MSLHFLRPYWLLALILVCILAFILKKQSFTPLYWKKACDAHLLPYLIQSTSQSSYQWLYPFLSLVFICIGLSGPAFIRLPVPIYNPQQAHVILLDLSHTMLNKEIKPSRLERAKFKLKDLFKSDKIHGQLGLIVYSGEPFVASPLTDDGKTLDGLLDALTPDIMPVAGNQLTSALWEGYQLLQQSGQTQGDILILTAEPPGFQALKAAKEISKKNVTISILPMTLNSQLESFQQLAQAGKGQMISFTETSEDIFKWLKNIKHSTQFKSIHEDTIPMWRDDGRWFLIPAVFFCLPLFRRGFRIGVNS